MKDHLINKHRKPVDSSIRMKELPFLDQPYEKLERDGEQTLTDTELLAILLKTGTRGISAITIARQIAALDYQKQGIAFLCRIPMEDLRSIPGVGRIKAILIKASVELGRRIARTGVSCSETIIRTPDDIALLVQEEMQQLSTEELRIVLLDNKNALIKIVKSAGGSVNSTLFAPRDIFKDAMKYNAASIILVHNHPSGDPTPSHNDFRTTLSLSNIGKDLDIPITDHIIIGRHGCESIQAVLRRHPENL